MDHMDKICLPARSDFPMAILVKVRRLFPEGRRVHVGKVKIKLMKL